MTVYGYARVSTPTQNIERQIRNIFDEYPKAKIYQEAYTGTKLDRPVFSKLLKKLKSGDTIVFDSVSRMSRTAEEGFNLYQELFTQGISLVFLKEPMINTDTYRKALDIELPKTDALFIEPILDGVKKALQIIQKEQIKKAFEQAEKEVTDLRQRTREGIQTARLHGKTIGRPEGSTSMPKKSQKAIELIQKHNRDFGGTLTDRETMNLAGISKPTFYKLKKLAKGE